MTGNQFSTLKQYQNLIHYKVSNFFLHLTKYHTSLYILIEMEDISHSSLDTLEPYKSHRECNPLSQDSLQLSFAATGIELNVISSS